MTTALEGGEGSASRPGRCLPRERPGTHCTGGWVGPRAGLERCGKSRPPPAFDPRTVQPVASYYTDWATRPTLGLSVDVKAPYIPLRFSYSENCRTSGNTSSDIKYVPFLVALTKFRKATISFAMSCLPVRLASGTTWLPLDEFWWNAIFEDIWNTCRENSNFIKIWQV